MKEFLARKIPQKPGNIVDKNGKILGTHDGAFSYTIGQRKGIKIGGGPALFVIAKDTTKNEIIVGTAEDLELFSKSCEIIDFVGKNLDENRDYNAKIRYRQADQKCQIQKIDEKNYKIIFDESQRAIASGQICVIYDGDLVVGSGIIK